MEHNWKDEDEIGREQIEEVVGYMLTMYASKMRGEEVTMVLYT